MDYSIRPVDQKTHSIAPRRKRDEERAPFDFGADSSTGEERRPSEQHPAPPERAVAPPGDGEIGANLDLCA